MDKGGAVRERDFLLVSGNDSRSGLFVLCNLLLCGDHF
jgi:hypothetical protein